MQPTKNAKLRGLRAAYIHTPWYAEEDDGVPSVCCGDTVIALCPTEHGAAMAEQDAQYIATMHNELDRLLVESDELAALKARESDGMAKRVDQLRRQEGLPLVEITALAEVATRTGLSLIELVLGAIELREGLRRCEEREGVTIRQLLGNPTPAALAAGAAYMKGGPGGV